MLAAYTLLTFSVDVQVQASTLGFNGTTHESATARGGISACATGFSTTTCAEPAQLQLNRIDHSKGAFNSAGDLTGSATGL